MEYKTTTVRRESQRKYRAAHLEEQRDAYRRWYQTVGKQREAEERNTIKIEVLTHYGKGKCACVLCGEARLACLSIDHISGNGCRERKQHGSGFFGLKFYKRLRKGGYPRGYQTLCMNCQFCKAVLDRSWNKMHEVRKFPKC